MSKNATIIIIVFVVLLICLSMIVCCVIGVGIPLLTNRVFESGSTETDEPEGNYTEEYQETPTEAFNPQASSLDQHEIDSDANETLNTLKSEMVPMRDMLQLAEKFGLAENPSRTVAESPKEFSKGDQESFWVLDSDSNEYIQIKAILRHITPHAYYWVQDKTRYDHNDLIQLADAFESQIYPVNREFFGEEWSPGVDHDEHLYILYTSGLGENIAGLYPTENSYVKEVFPYSNEHEIFMIDSSQDLNDPYTYGVLAHEFQHMIHWYRDLNEENWLNEGMADLAIFINGYDVGGFDYLFAENPDIQLNFWPEDSDEQDAHYGASFLFFNYILDRFGEDVTKAIVASPQNGFESIDQVLTERQVKDPISNKLFTADKIFTDWTITNYLLDGYIDDGRYTYQDYDLAPQVVDTEVIKCPITTQDRNVSQYGADYIRLKCSGDFSLTFTGEKTVNITEADPHSGRYAFWSNFGDESDMTLTRRFDFTEITGPIQISYWASYDIEEDYDYLYVMVSEDGENWGMLEPSSCTNDNPTGANFGCGYNGISDGWINETIDLSKFAGKSIYLQFEYITDAVVSRDGFIIDDISIPAINYFEDFEKGEGGWQGEGFVRIQNTLPQTYRLSIIRIGSITQVDQYIVENGSVLNIPLKISQDEQVVMVVSGTTRVTRMPAWYSFVIK